MPKYSNYQARTKYANNAMTDSEPKVWHIVTFTADGQERQLSAYAKDPMDAISLVRNAHMYGEEDRLANGANPLKWPQLS